MSEHEHDFAIKVHRIAGGFIKAMRTCYGSGPIDVAGIRFFGSALARALLERYEASVDPTVPDPTGVLSVRTNPIQQYVRHWGEKPRKLGHPPPDPNSRVYTLLHDVMWQTAILDAIGIQEYALSVAPPDYALEWAANQAQGQPIESDDWLHAPAPCLWEWAPHQAQRQESKQGNTEQREPGHEPGHEQRNEPGREQSIAPGSAQNAPGKEQSGAQQKEQGNEPSEELYLPASYYSDKHGIKADVLWHAFKANRIRSKKVGNRRLYADADVRAAWPQNFLRDRDR